MHNVMLSILLTIKAAANAGLWGGGHGQYNMHHAFVEHSAVHQGLHNTLGCGRRRHGHYFSDVAHTGIAVGLVHGMHIFLEAHDVARLRKEEYRALVRG